MVYFIIAYRDLEQFSIKYDSYNSPHVYCLVTIILQSVALLCDLAHQVKFSEDGRGWMFLEVMGTILDMVSESIMTLLVLMLANGWMTGFVKNDYDDYLDVWAPIMMVVMVVHVLSGGLTYVD